MSRYIKCDACGKQETDVKGWYMDEFKNVFCTNVCYTQEGKIASCVSVLDFRKLMETAPEKRNIFYTDANTQLTSLRLKPGETIDTEKHADATQTILLIQGTLKVTIFRDDVSYPFVLANATPNTMTVIPCNTPHRLENEGLEDTILFVTYSPPVHKV